MSRLQLRVPDPAVDPDPFGDDALDRQESVTILADLVSRVASPCVIALDAPWGEGKTTLVRMWQQVLERRGTPTLYFNAWESDHGDDPLAALAGELLGAASSLEAIDAAALHKWKQKAIAVAKWTVPAAVRVLLPGILDFAENLETELASVASEYSANRIDRYAESKASISGFRSSLESLVKPLQEAKTPLIFFIDELDRCRPTYAVELLERAKHLFSVSGIVFVLSIDSAQLAHCIRSVYGEHYDAETYLRRFVDLSYRLPRPKSGAFAEHLFHRLGLSQMPPGYAASQHHNRSELLPMLKALFELFSFSLRQQQQCASRLGVVLGTIPPNHYLHDVELASLIAIHEWSNTLYQRYAKQNAGAQEILEAIAGIPGGRGFLRTHRGTLLEACLAAGADELAGAGSHLARYQHEADADVQGSDQERLQELIRMMGYFMKREHRGNIRRTIDRIAIGSNFVPIGDVS